MHDDRERNGGNHRRTQSEHVGTGDRARGLSGEVVVTSLHLMVFTPSGQRVFEGRGELDFIQAIDLSAVPQKFPFQLRMRNDLFQDEEVLHEAIEIAFFPYLSPFIEL